MRRPRRRPVGPIYIFGLVWLAYSLFFPLLRLSAFLLAAGLSLAAAVGLGTYLARKGKQRGGEGTAQAAPAAGAAAQAASTAAQEEPKPRYAPEVEAILADGSLAMREMGRLYGSIENPEIRGKINELMSVSDKIVRDAIDDPSDVPQIRKFLDFYLPTTIKLLNAYDRMDAQGVEGENISGSKKSIEEMLDTTIDAYKKQLDALFANQAMDIDTDIRVMNGMLAQEGLGGKSYLDFQEFMKEYNKEKGSTQNG